MQRIQKVIPIAVVVLALGFGITACSNSSTSPNSGNNLSNPQMLNLTNLVPTGLQSNSPAAYQMIIFMQSQMSIGQAVFDTISTELGGNTGDFTATDGQLTVHYSGAQESKNGMDGVSWTITFNGTIQIDDTTTATFNNDQIFSGWTSNDGSNGNFTFDYSAYANASGSGAGADSTLGSYDVQWSETSDNVVTVQSTIQSSSDTLTYGLTINADGSGTISQNGSTMYAWDSNGNLINNGG